MKLLTEDLLTEFYLKTNHKFPDITFEEAKNICYSPFKCFKQEMESGELSEVRFKYIGTFKVYPKRAEKMLIKLKENFESVDDVEYLRIEKMLIKFVNKYESR